MSADYWNSTQRKFWKFSRKEIEQKRKYVENYENRLLASGVLPIHIKDISYNTEMRIYLHSCVQKLGNKLGIRAVPLGTAEVYLLRFLLNVSLKEVNLYLLITTCIYLGCKIEESPYHIRTISNEARNLWPEYIPNDITKIAEFEFYLIEEMQNYLIIHNSYRALDQIRNVLSLTSFTMSSAVQNSGKLQDGVNCLVLTQKEIESAWQVINDSHATDLPLLYPPHIIAICAIYMAVVIGRTEIDEGRLNVLTSFIAMSNVDLAELTESVQEMLSLYEVWESFDEGVMRKRVHKLFVNRI